MSVQFKVSVAAPPEKSGKTLEAGTEKIADSSSAGSTVVDTYAEDNPAPTLQQLLEGNKEFIRDCALESIFNELGEGALGDPVTGDHVSYDIVDSHQLLKTTAAKDLNPEAALNWYLTQEKAIIATISEHIKALDETGYLMTPAEKDDVIKNKGKLELSLSQCRKQIEFMQQYCGWVAENKNLSAIDADVTLLDYPFIPITNIEPDET